MISNRRSFLYCASIKAGIFRATFDTQAGTIGEPTLLPETPKSFFLVRHPSLPVLYSLDIAGGKVGALSMADDGGLTLLGEVDSEGAAPCHLVVDPAGRFVVVANYNGGVSLFGLNADGHLSPAASVYQPTGSSIDPERQAGPHPHGVTLIGELVYVADLGIDRIIALRVECDPLRLTPVPEHDVTVCPGAGPRHFTLHRSGRAAVAVNELNNTVTAFRVDPANSANGSLHAEGTLSTLPTGYEGVSWTAELDFHPSVDICYATNRGHDSLALFSIDPETAELRAGPIIPCNGVQPQHFVFDSSGTTLFVACSGSNSVPVFRVNRETGIPLEQIGKLEVVSPMGLLWVDI